MKNSRGLPIFIVLTSLLVLPPHPALAAPASAESTSKNTPFLENALQRFPDSDLNHDGVLTQSEAMAYRKKVLGNRPEKLAKKKQKAAAADRKPAPAPAFENVAYGPHKRNVLDFWQAKSATPAPVLVCIHGGGFVGGDKSKFRADAIVSDCLAKGVSVAALNYRYVTIAPFPAPMHDAARAIQLIRSKAKEWNVDPQRIGAMGGSAGANISLWLACHDDLADPKSADPVARQSTRLSLMVGTGTQTFNDPELIRKYIYAGSSIHTSFIPFYGMKDPAEMSTERVKKLAHEASAYYFVTKDDPPVYLNYNGSNQGAPLPDGTQQGVYIHHARFGEVFKEKYDALGLECVLHYREKPAAPGESLQFILKHFGMGPQTAAQ